MGKGLVLSNKLGVAAAGHPAERATAGPTRDAVTGRPADRVSAADSAIVRAD